MAPPLDHDLSRWVEARLIEPAQAGAILDHEARLRAEAPARLRWPALLAIAFGGLLVGAGALLFVAAHWDRMSPAARFAAVLAMVLLFHLAGAGFARRMPRLATALHGVGTLVLGAGIFLAGQIFNLQEHWPGGMLLWALGAWGGWFLLRDWVQGTLAALLTPWWLGGEWMEAARGGWAETRRAESVLAAGILALAIVYLTARHGRRDSLQARALAWAGGLGLIPAVLFLVATAQDHGWRRPAPAPGMEALGWGAALGGPLLVALATRGRGAWMSAAALAWVALLAQMPGSEWPVYAWCALGCVGLAAWGLVEERRERINLAVAGFALVVLFFYFSDVMDKLGRSLGLMVLGLLFLAGGWQLERLRRRLNALVPGGAR